MNPALYIAIPMLALSASIIGYEIGPLVVDHYRTEHLLVHGTTATAVVLDIKDSGIRYNNETIGVVHVLVSPEAGETFESDANAVVSGLNVGPLRIGNIIRVKYDRKHTNHVAIIFDSNG